MFSPHPVEKMPWIVKICDIFAAAKNLSDVMSENR